VVEIIPRDSSLATWFKSYHGSRSSLLVLVTCRGGGGVPTLSWQLSRPDSVVVFPHRHVAVSPRRTVL
jgi:hypothetical protein